MLGKNQRKILEYLEKRGPTLYTDLLHEFAMYQYKAGDLKGYPSYSKVTKTLLSLYSKRLITITNGNRPDCMISLAKENGDDKNK